MRELVIGVAVSAILAGQGLAATTAAPDPAAPPKAFIDAFNKGDAKTAKAAHWAAGASIIDEVPPHLWQGATGFDDWAAALAASDKAKGIDHEMVTLGDVVRTEVTGRHAYVIYEAVYTFQQHGKPMREPARMTFAMRKSPEGEWKIAAWTWTGGKPRAVAP